MSLNFLIVNVIAIMINSGVATATTIILAAVLKNFFYLEDGVGAFTLFLLFVILLTALFSCYICHFYLVKPLLLNKKKEK